MSCPLWRPDCQASAVINAAADTAHGVAATAQGVGAVAHAAGSTAGALGGLLPLLVIAAVLWALLKLLTAGRAVATGVADGFTGGAVNRTEEALRPSKAARAKSGGRARPGSSTSSARRLGEQKGAEQRRRRNVTRGPRPMFHDGRQPQVIHRADDKAGRPTVVTVCAPDPGTAAALIGMRMNSQQWRPGTNKRCDLNPRSHHFTFRKA